MNRRLRYIDTRRTLEARIRAAVDLHQTEDGHSNATEVEALCKEMDAINPRRFRVYEGLVSEDRSTFFDYDECSIGDLIVANMDSIEPVDIEAVFRMDLGDAYWGGGGAAAEYTVKRVQ